MGRKRKYKKRNSKKNQNTKRNVDLFAIIGIIVGIVLTVLIYGETGEIGAIISPVLGGVVGVIKYIFPIGIIAVSISILRQKYGYFTSKMAQYIIFLACIAGMMSIYQISKGYLDINSEFTDALHRAYELGKTNHGGGTVGTVIAYPLVKMLGMFGAAATTTGVAVIMLVFSLSLKPSDIIVDILEGIEERRQESKEYKEAELQSRHEERTRRVQSHISNEKNAKNKNVILKMENMMEETPSNVDEEQIKINLNNQDDDENSKRFSIFGKRENIEKNDNEAKNINPNELEENLFVQKVEEKEAKTRQVLQLEHNATLLEDENYEFPPVQLLKQGERKTVKGKKTALTETATKLQKTLYSFGVSAKVENVSVGPAITRYELKPAEGVRVSKIAKLADDIALNLAAETIRIEAPIPGKQAVGIEIPNKEKEIVPLRDIIETDAFKEAKSKLSMALGKDIAGEPVIADISKMPHVLIAGSTGSGKSVCINTLIASIIYKSKPSEAKLVMIDPKVVELSVYNGIPHLLIPVVTDPRKAAGALAWAVQEMENRYQLFASKGVRDLKGYNEVAEKDELMGKMPQIVIIIDELADLMMVAAKEVEDSICRLAQKARAAGMHLVIATQRPSVDVITGIIKANVPSRISFAVSSQIDSRTILDMAGAEKLLGKGDMLFYPIGSSKPVRVQGAFISDKEVEKVVDFVKSNGGETKYNEDIIQSIENANKSDKEKDLDNQEEDDVDPFLNEAIELVIEVGQASTSFIQRRFKVGYARAGRIIDQMEARGIISGYEGSKPRQVLMSKERWYELNMSQAPQNTDENN